MIDYTIICTHSENMRSYNGDQLDVTKNIRYGCVLNGGFIDWEGDFDMD